MSFKENEMLIYRVETAEEALEDARIMMEKARFRAATNRLYYTAFYILLAIFLKKKTRLKSHSGVKSLFHEQFVKTG